MNSYKSYYANYWITREGSKKDFLHFALGSFDCLHEDEDRKVFAQIIYCLFHDSKNLLLFGTEENDYGTDPDMLAVCRAQVLAVLKEKVSYYEVVREKDNKADRSVACFNLSQLSLMDVVNFCAYYRITILVSLDVEVDIEVLKQITAKPYIPFFADPYDEMLWAKYTTSSVLFMPAEQSFVGLTLHKL